MRMRWVGIDEAGYGPNLGPLVMTAVMAEGPDDRPPDVWDDLAESVCRAGEKGSRLWVDDSKRVYAQGKGFDRLEAATLATIEAAGLAVPRTLGELLGTLGVPEEEAELARWLDPAGDPAVPRYGSIARVERARIREPFRGCGWRIAGVRSVVVGPGRFNRGLDASGSKAVVHFDAFARLLAWAWEDGNPAIVRGDKHGGRHFYGEPLRRAFPAATIEPGEQGPAVSRYRIEDAGRRLDLELVPRADSGDGLVALASIVSKCVREHWMTAFNAFWAARVPGLRPSAGYPVDAARFRADVLARWTEPEPPMDRWWRRK